VVAALGVGVVVSAWFHRAPAIEEYDGEVMVSPAEAKPGQVVDVTLRTDDGSPFWLQKEGRRKALYLLFGTRDPGKEPTWARAEDAPEGGYLTFSVQSSAPQRVLIPPPIPAGTYSLCVAGERPSCVRLKVAR
jgi:hypothetical protein